MVYSVFCDLHIELGLPFVLIYFSLLSYVGNIIFETIIFRLNLTLSLPPLYYFYINIIYIWYFVCVLKTIPTNVYNVYVVYTYLLPKKYNEDVSK